MAYPRTSEELKDAGYKFSGFGECSVCRCAIEWYLTPHGKKLPLLLMKKGSDPVRPHWSNGCQTRSLF